MDGLKHTPGPWAYRDGIVTADGVNPLWHPDVPPETAEADARLVAAAPELLAACQWVLARLENPKVQLGKSQSAQMLRDAIAKATGEDIE